MRRRPSCTITATSYEKVGSYDTQLGMVADRTWLCPSSCCKPSPFNVVRPDVPPIRKPRERMSPAAQAKSPTRWKPNME